MGLMENYRQSIRCEKGLMVRLSPHSYYVGDSWVGVVLIETADGIVMIDSGITGHMGLILDSIRRLGYDPQRDIRLCLLSHAHCDHCSGMAYLQSVAKPLVYMSKLEKDWPGHALCYAGLPEELDPVAPFTADRFYDGRPITYGGMTVLPVHTPGHTPGTTSFFFEDTAADGTVYRVGLHGGLGQNTLYNDHFADEEQAKNARRIYRDSVRSLLNESVDITVSNHGGNMDLLGRRKNDPMDYSGFVDPSFWRRHLEAKLRQLEDSFGN